MVRSEAHPCPSPALILGELPRSVGTDTGWCCWCCWCEYPATGAVAPRLAQVCCPGGILQRVPAVGPAPGQRWRGARDRCGHVPLLDSRHPQAAGTSPSAARAPRPGRGAVPASLLFLAALCFCCGDVLRLLLREGQDQKVLKRPLQRPACERPSACCLRGAGAALPWGRTV